MKMFDVKFWYNTIYTGHIEHAEMYPKQPYVERNISVKITHGTDKHHVFHIITLNYNICHTS
jgi:hypothetical protein